MSAVEVQKNLPMPSFPECEVDEEFLKMRSVSRRARTENIDFNSFFDIIVRKDCSEYNGCCSRVNREQGQSLRPKTQTVYMPLIDMVLATPTTMQTSIKQAKTLADQHGQTFCVYTSDQQLYRIAVMVLWNTPDHSKDFYLGCIS